MTDKIMEVYAQIYNWRVDSKGRPVPPYVMHPLPDFVMKRIEARCLCLAHACK